MRLHGVRLFGVLRALLLGLLLTTGGKGTVTAQIVYSDPQELLSLSARAMILEDAEHRLTAEEVAVLPDTAFTVAGEDILNFRHTSSKYWLKFLLQNTTDKELTLLVENPLIHHLNVFVTGSDGTETTYYSGNFTFHSTRSFNSSAFTFELGRNPTGILIETSTKSDFFFPVYVGAAYPITKSLHRNDIFNGAYLGLMLAMLLYNLFIFITIKDRVYFYYILHIGITLLMMLRFRGIGFDLFWPEMPLFNSGSSVFLCLIIVTSILFSTRFLDTANYAPKAHKFLVSLAGVAAVLFLTALADWQPWSNILVQADAAILSFSLIFIAILVYRRGHKSAKYYLLAWTVLLIANIILIMTLNGALPITFFTLTSFQIGSALEAVLLSNALANKINTYKIEREKAQTEIIEKTRENERLVKEQNVLLEQKVSQRTSELHAAKEQSDRLLLNILPASVAEELKKNGHALPRFYENISVMFIDIAGFTKYSETVSHERLVRDIDCLFTGFDRICQRVGVEKIKTIGDAYMAVAGLPNPDSGHAAKVLLAAAECLKFVEEEKQTRPFFDIRIGIHSGSAVAGVVGEKKFAYDIWGDTVNTAARVESASEKGKISVSQSTRDLAAEVGQYTYRGKVKAKDKGEMDMYFWESCTK